MVGERVSERRIEFFVPGVPVGKGSLRAFTRKGGGVGVEEGNVDKVRPWMSSITLAARDLGVSSEEGAVTVGMAFWFPRPKSHFTPKGALRPEAAKYPAGKPDIDKLVRAVLDALANVAFADDSRVVGLEPAPWKRYATDLQPPGVHIVVERIQ